MQGIITITKTLLEPVQTYREKRRYGSLSQAANELIRIGLEQETKK
jgi:hypothetical protein